MTHYHSYRQPAKPSDDLSSHHPSVTNRAVARRLFVRLAKYGLLGLVIALSLQFGVWMPHNAYTRQSERNRAAAESVRNALDIASGAAKTFSVPAYWIQSRADAGNAPYMGGSAWHVEFGGNQGMQTVTGGELDPDAGVNLYCPGAEVGFDAAGQPRNGPLVLRIYSADPGQALLIDVAADGSTSIREAQS